MRASRVCKNSLGLGLVFLTLLTLGCGKRLVIQSAQSSTGARNEPQESFSNPLPPEVLVPVPPVAVPALPLLAPSPVSTLAIQDQYQYLTSAVGLSLSSKETACQRLGSGWGLAKLDGPNEIFQVREFLTKYASPRPGDPKFAIPTIATRCEEVKAFRHPTIDFGVDCSGDKLLIVWPGVYDDGDEACRSKPCAFEDVSDPSRWPALCEKAK